MATTKIPTLSKANADIARAEMLAVIEAERAELVRSAQTTFDLHVRAGKAYWNAYVSVIGDDNVKPIDVKFADMNTALKVSKDKPFLNLRAMATLNEDYVAMRAAAITENAFIVAGVEYKKAEGKDATSFRAIAPHLRTIGSGSSVTSNRKGSDESIARAAQLAHDKTVAWNYGYQGAFTGADENEVPVEWTTADKNLIRGLLNRSGVDMAALRATPKADIELLRQLLNGICDDVKANGPTPLPVVDTELPDVAVKTNARRKAK